MRALASRHDEHEHNMNIDGVVISRHLLIMPKGTQPRITPRRFATLGGMVKEQVRVRSICRKCDTALEVDPAMLMAFYGPGYSLIGRTDPCRCVGCSGEVFYLANGHGRFEPLTH
jgi:hypothetical protein